MKILLVTGNYLPGKNGGIENYTHWLASLLLQNNFGVEIAALNPHENSDYFYEGIKVHNLKNSFLTFEDLLKNEHFDICHFHEYSEYGGIEIPWLKKAKEYSKKIFFTFHLPYLTCYKGDFRYRGIEDCNTFTDNQRCTECVIAEKINYKKLWKSNAILESAVVMLGVTGIKEKLEQKIKAKHHGLDELICLCEQVFVIAGWFKTILSRNGYNNINIRKIPNQPKSLVSFSSLAQNGLLKNKIVFIGRVQQQKGLHLLCKAMRLLKMENIEVDVYGNLLDQEYYENCKKDFVFNFKGTANREGLLGKLKEYDFLVLPSIFTEMFPLVIMEAFHRNLPVIASTAKGNKDVIADGVNGFLFDYDNANDLAITIEKAYRLKKNGWLPQFTNPVSPEKDVEEIISWYRL